MKHVKIAAFCCVVGLFVGLGVLHGIAPSQIVTAQLQENEAYSQPKFTSNRSATAPLTSTTPITVYLPLIGMPESTISGHILDGSTPVTGVFLSTSTGRTGMTDATSVYQIYVPNGMQSITPTLAGFVFSPTMRSVTVPPSAQNQDFEAAPPPCAATIDTVLYDDFSNPNSGWGEQNIAAWYRHYTNGEYEANLYVNVQMHHTAPNIGETLDNFVVGADLRQTDTPEYGDGYGLWIGSNSLGKYYEFYVRTNTVPALGNYSVVYYDMPASTWTGKASGTSAAVNMGTAVNTLGVHRCGLRYYFTANDAVLTSLVLPELANQPLTVGYYARAAHSATIRVDNFRVQRAAP